MSDNITVGNIQDSFAVAIGAGATAITHITHASLAADQRPKYALSLPKLTPAFTGRLVHIQTIADTFVAGSSWMVAQVISGMGGVGKTQLALAYAHLYRAAYDIIWHLSAESGAAIDNDLRRLGVTLELPLYDMEPELVRSKVLSRLSESGERALLLYDNADAIPLSDLQDYLPHGCHILITSRRGGRQWDKLAKLLMLETFAEAEGMAFWMERMGLDSESEMEAERALGKVLGWLPLAMEQAAAFMVHQQMSAADYLAWFEEERESLWDEEKAPDDYHETVATTWRIGFDHVKKREGAADLLNLCCFLAPDNISLDMLIEHADSLPDGLTAVLTNSRKRTLALTALRDYSLLIRDENENVLSMHRLVQLVARERMGDAQQIWAGAALDLLSKVYHFDPHDMNTWTICGELLSHVSVAFRLAAELGIENEQVAYLNDQAGFYLQHDGLLKDALPFFQKSLDIRQKTLGEDHPRVANSLNNIGELLYMMGDYESIRPFFQQALDIRQKTLGNDHPDTAEMLNNMAMLLQTMGDYEGAQPFYQQALDIRQKTLGNDHPDTAESLNNMGYLLQAMGNYEGALPLYQETLTIFQKVLGDNHPYVATANNNLGMMLQMMGNYESAQLFLEKALDIRTDILGVAHPQVALSLNNIGLLFQAMKEYEDARPFLEQALDIRDIILGSNHPDTAYSLNNMGLLMQEMGDNVEARNYYQRALVIFETKLGADHPHTKDTRQNLMLLNAQADTDE